MYISYLIFKISNKMKKTILIIALLIVSFIDVNAQVKVLNLLYPMVLVALELYRLPKKKTIKNLLLYELVKKIPIKETNLKEMK